MSAVDIFRFTETRTDIRVVTIDGDPWFVARDVCRALGMAHAKNVPSVLCSDELLRSEFQTPVGQRKVLLISEPGLYKLVSRSTKPAARAFDRWVRHVVLPPEAPGLRP